MYFENRFYATEQMNREYVYKVIFRKTFILGTIMLILAGLTFVFAIKVNQPLAIAEGVCFLILLITMTIAPILTVKQLSDFDKKFHNGTTPQCVVEFGENIKMTEGTQSISVEYTQINRIYRLKSCNIMMFTKQNGIIYDRDGFTAGNNEDFEKFILEKCTNVKRIEKRG